MLHEGYDQGKTPIGYNTFFVFLSARLSDRCAEMRLCSEFRVSVVCKRIAESTGVRVEGGRVYSVLAFRI